MEDRETARMRKYGESNTTRIMMATVPHVTSGLGLIKFQADGFLLARVYNSAIQPLKSRGVGGGLEGWKTRSRLKKWGVCTSYWY